MFFIGIVVRNKEVKFGLLVYLIFFQFSVFKFKKLLNIICQQKRGRNVLMLVQWELSLCLNLLEQKRKLNFKMIIKVFLFKREVRSMVFVNKNFQNKQQGFFDLCNVRKIFSFLKIKYDVDIFVCCIGYYIDYVINLFIYGIFIESYKFLEVE